MKFGGTSVQSPEMMRQVAQIVTTTQSATPVAVVVSAMSGVTDQLEKVATLASNGDESYAQLKQEIEKKHLQCVSELLPVNNQSATLAAVKVLLNELDDVLQGLFLLKELTPKSRDFVMSFGERFSSHIITEYFKCLNVPAVLADCRQLILTDNNFGNAAVQFDETYRRLREYFAGAKGKLVVLPGFIGATAKGETTTLGRGGSDYTAAIVAAGVGAELLEIWTDVDGMMTADPRKVQRTIPLKQLSYIEALELSHFGAKVLYPPSVQPVLSRNIPLKIKNTFHPDREGTLITRETEKNAPPVKGISSIDSVALLSLMGSGMVGVSGFASRLFSALATGRINIILITQASSEHSITLAVTPHDAPQAQALIEAEFRRELEAKQVEPVKVEYELSILAVVGENMKNTPNLAGQLFSALGKNGVNVRAIAQGSSEHNISLVTSQADCHKALNVIHEAFFLSEIKVLNLFVTGTGTVGKTLLKQMAEQIPHILREHNLDIRIAGLANSRKMHFNPAGIELTHWGQHLEGGEKMDLTHFAARMTGLNLRNSILVDCTASDQVPQLYAGALERGISVVTPNKVACSGPYGKYRELKQMAARRGVKFLFETNVGAGLPIIKTLNDLVQSGDKIVRIEAILSGTLNYVFNEHKEGTLFSQVVRKAQELGYSEPDPRIDLSGVDVARKILILAREAGARLEWKDVERGNLLPESCQLAPTVDEFFEVLHSFDGRFEVTRRRAENEGKRQRYVATYEDGTASTGLRSFGPEHPFFQVEGNDNMVLFTTERYKARPLIVKGAGAGAEVTAAGVFADIIRIANL
jgi:aspartokinase/homoserine dehydrogenase 1